LVITEPETSTTVTLGVVKPAALGLGVLGRGKLDHLKVVVVGSVPFQQTNRQIDANDVLARLALDWDDETDVLDAS
jgi:hypothetical protein